MLFDLIFGGGCLVTGYPLFCFTIYPFSEEDTPKIYAQVRVFDN